MDLHSAPNASYAVSMMDVSDGALGKGKPKVVFDRPQLFEAEKSMCRAYRASAEAV